MLGSVSLTGFQSGHSVKSMNRIKMNPNKEKIKSFSSFVTGSNLVFVLFIWFLFSDEFTGMGFCLEFMHI